MRKNACENLKKVMTECASEIESFGIELPDEFSCERFPRKDSDHPCIPIQMHTEELPPGTLRWNIEETSMQSRSLQSGGFQTFPATFS